MQCNACERQIGLPASWAAHSRLCVVEDIGGPDPSSAMRYACDACRTIFVRGRAKGWALAETPAPPFAQRH